MSIWKPNPGPQEEALKRIEFEILYGGARGGGKTDAGLVWATDDVENPLLRTLIIRKNADDLSDWRDRAQRMYKSLGAELVGHPGIIRFPSGARFKLGHLKDENAYTKYQGHEYQRIVIEELTQIPTEKAYLQLLASCRSTVENLKPHVFLTTNPGGLGHGWVKKRFIDTADMHSYDYKDITGNQKQGLIGNTYIEPSTGLSRIFVPAKVDDNPILLSRDPGYMRMLEGLKSVDFELWKAWRLGSWDVFAGQAFKEWRYDKHVTDRFEFRLEQCTKIITFDWGYNAPGCAHWLALTPENRYGVSRIYLYRELYQNEKTPEQWADQLAMFTDFEETKFMVLPHDCFATPHGNKSIAEIFARKLKTKIIPGDTMSKGARNNRVSLTHQFLSDASDGTPYLQVHPKCKKLIETLPLLVYDEKNVEDIDSSGDDHAYDALSMGLMTLQSKYKVNSGAVSPRSLKQEKTVFTADSGGSYVGPDFLKEIKKQMKSKHKHWEVS
jgi:hypothetical protein